MPQTQQAISPAESSCQGNISGPEGRVSRELGDAIRAAEKVFDCPVWSIVHAQIVPGMYNAFYEHLRELRETQDGNGIALLIESRGGFPDAAYRIAALLRRACGTVRVLVPHEAWSAATLIAVSGTEIYLGTEGVLGPLDVHTTESVLDAVPHYAIDEVQSLDALYSAARRQARLTAEFLSTELPSVQSELYLPYSLGFAGRLAAPLVDKIETVHYTGQSRLLKMSEAYAARLLQPRLPEDEAKEVARHLVNDYPSHDFVIGYDEAKDILKFDDPTREQHDVLDRLCAALIKNDEDFLVGALTETR